MNTGGGNIRWKVDTWNTQA